MITKTAALIAAGVVLYMVYRPSRNVRNNNPLNIRFSESNQWEGQTGHDGSFARFESAAYGFRAAYKLLMTYRDNYHLTSINDIVSRWAPEHENDSDAYASYLADKLNKWRFTPVFESEYPALLFYMAEFEGAKGAFSMSQVYEGIALA